MRRLISALAAIGVLTTLHACSSDPRGPRGQNLSRQLNEQASDAHAYGAASFEHLSETGLYSNWSDRTLAPGIRTYTPRFSLYSDNLVKRRFILIPQGSAIEPQDQEIWHYPNGTKIWKELSVQQGEALIPIETRYMEKVGPTWTFASYIWNHSQTAATRWAGQDGSVPVVVDLPPTHEDPTPQHEVPSYGECGLCHDQRSANPDQLQHEPVLGFTSFQLPRDEINSLLAGGVIGEPPTPIVWQRHRTFALSALERDVVGYIHANCGHCHNPRRPYMIPGAGNPTFHLNYSMETHVSRIETNIIKQIGQAFVSNGGLLDLPGDAKLLVKGRPDASMIFLRMQKATNEHRMPLLGIKSTDASFINSRLRPWIMAL